MLKQFSPEEFAALDAGTILGVTPTLQEGIAISYTVALADPAPAVEVAQEEKPETVASLWEELSGIGVSAEKALPLLEQAIELMPPDVFRGRCEDAILIEIEARKLAAASKPVAAEKEAVPMLELLPVAQMTAKQISEELAWRKVPGRSKGTKSAKQAMLCRARVEQDCEVAVSPEGEVVIITPNEVAATVAIDYYTMLAEQEIDNEARACLRVEPDEISNLEDMSAKWWTPAAVTAYIKPLVDPACADGKAYVHAPSLCAFVFKLGEKIFSQKTFCANAWAATWQVRLAMIDERTGRPEVSAFV